MILNRTYAQIKIMNFIKCIVEHKSEGKHLTKAGVLFAISKIVCSIQKLKLKLRGLCDQAITKWQL